MWLRNELNPEDWSWKLVENSLEPIRTFLPPVVGKLSNIIFCDFEKVCGNNSWCGKLGFSCSPICSNCQGQFYPNIESNTTDEDT